MSNHPTLKPFNFQKWVAEHADLLRPPVGNQLLHKEGDMIVMVVGGPNQRADYHDDPVEEFFYQLKGDMLLKVVDDGEHYDIPIREGDVFLLPAHVRHSPQRPQEGSIGLVIEPERPEGALDAIEWYCFNCQALVHRAEIDLESIVDDLPPIYNAFYEQTELRKCPECGEMHPGKVPPEGWVQL